LVIVLVVNSLKITPIKYLMCGTSNNQAIKIKCMEVISTNKSRKHERKERENTKEFVDPVRSKLT